MSTSCFASIEWRYSPDAIIYLPRLCPGLWWQSKHVPPSGIMRSFGPGSVRIELKETFTRRKEQYKEAMKDQRLWETYSWLCKSGGSVWECLKLTCTQPRSWSLFLEMLTNYLHHSPKRHCIEAQFLLVATTPPRHLVAQLNANKPFGCHVNGLHYTF